MTEHKRIPLKRDQAAIPTILVVANDLMLIKLLEKALKLELECEVLFITTGRGALETAKSVTPDLLIIDSHLLDFNALELSDQLHSIKELESVPTILINSLATSWSERQGDHTIFLRMPFVLADFYVAVNKSLDRN